MTTNTPSQTQGSFPPPEKESHDEADRASIKTLTPTKSNPSSPSFCNNASASSPSLPASSFSVLSTASTLRNSITAIAEVNADVDANASTGTSSTSSPPRKKWKWFRRSLSPTGKKDSKQKWDAASLGSKRVHAEAIITHMAMR